MELELAFEVVNWLAVIVSALVVFVIGGIWYSPAVFGRPGIVARDAESRGGPPRRLEAIFAVVFVMQLLAAALFAAILGPNASVGFGIQVGLLIGTFFVTPAFAISYIFERRPVRHVLVNGGYQIVSFAVMGAIIGAWY